MKPGKLHRKQIKINYKVLYPVNSILNNNNKKKFEIIIKKTQLFIVNCYIKKLI
jgi:hypothetical protein